MNFCSISGSNSLPGSETRLGAGIDGLSVSGLIQAVLVLTSGGQIDVSLNCSRVANADSSVVDHGLDVVHNLLNGGIHVSGNLSERRS